MSSRRLVGQGTQRTETHVERKTVALRNAYPTGLRQWGMLITVFNDAVPANNKTYQLNRGVSSTNKSDNANWQEFTGGGGGGGTEHYKGTWDWAANANANPVAWVAGDYGYGVGERFNPGDAGYVADGQKIDKTNAGFKYT